MLPVYELMPLDQYAIDRAYELQQELKQDYDDYQLLQVVQKVHNFCAGDLGSFYLDVIKDRQYTTKTDSIAHRSCQTAMYHILEAMVRWITPILPFTSDEMWKAIPGERDSNIFVAEWYEHLQPLADDSKVSIETWQLLADIRLAVNKQIELKRNEGLIGGSLEARVTLYLSQKHSAKLAQMAHELRFILITSAARIRAIEQADDKAVKTDIDGVTLLIEKVEFEKCERCWHRVEDIGQDPEHPTICLRCVTNVVGDGETRDYA